MYKICFYVPETHVEKVKAAIFTVGAGKIGDYGSCCWQVLGEGQFKPLAGSQPYLGQRDQLETVAEYKVETVCQDADVWDVVAALKEAHPYEEPAYDVWQLADI